MTLAKGRIDYFNTGWTMIRADGRQQGIESLPYAGESNAEEVIILENRIPQEYAGKTLSFLSAEKTITVVLDGTEIYTFGTKDKKIFGHTAGSITNFIDIPEHFTKGNIKIIMQSPYKGYAAEVAVMRIASRDVMILQLLRENQTEHSINNSQRQWKGGRISLGPPPPSLLFRASQTEMPRLGFRVIRSLWTTISGSIYKGQRPK